MTEAFKARSSFFDLNIIIEKETPEARMQQALIAFGRGRYMDGPMADFRVAPLAAPNKDEFSYVTLIKEPLMYTSVMINGRDITATVNTATGVLRLLFDPKR